MMKRTTWLLLVVFLGVVRPAAAATAQETEPSPPFVKKVNVSMGRISSLRVRGDQVVFHLKAEHFREWDILLKKSMKISRGKKKVNWKTLKVGDRVKVRHTNNKDDEQVVREMWILDASKAPEAKTSKTETSSSPST